MKICDVCGLPEELCVCEEIAREALRLAMHKLPIKCKFVVKEEDGEQ